MLDQAGQKARAIDEYRKVVADGWIFEQKAKVATFQRFVTSEAAGYLIPLLDPQRDEAEIRDLRAKIEHLQRLPRPITPIAIPLEEHVDMKTIVNPLARVFFDADGSGRRREWTWITRDAGWLVYDAKDKGEILQPCNGSATSRFGCSGTTDTRRSVPWTTMRTASWQVRN
jgi:hypothetical protein